MAFQRSRERFDNVSSQTAVPQVTLPSIQNDNSRKYQRHLLDAGNGTPSADPASQLRFMRNTLFAFYEPA
jgi:hypothetical protein